MKEPGNIGNLHIEIYAWEAVFQWLVVDHGQQSLGHPRIVAQGSDPRPWYAQAAARQARHELLVDQPPGETKLKKTKTRAAEIRAHRNITQAELPACRSKRSSESKAANCRWRTAARSECLRPPHRRFDAGAGLVVEFGNVRRIRV